MENNFQGNDVESSVETFPMAVSAQVVTEPRFGAIYRKNGKLPADVSSHRSGFKMLFIDIGQSHTKGRCYVPKRITMTELMGGVGLDFSDAIFVFPKTTIISTALLGSTTIKVPRGVRIEIKGIGLLGGFSKTEGEEWNEDSPVLILKGFHILGSVHVEVNMEVPPLFLSYDATEYIQASEISSS